MQMRHRTRRVEDGNAHVNGARREIRYPERDGKPMGESETHIRELMRLLQTLDGVFAARADVYVGADLILYYQEGNPRASVVPDLFVAIGAPKQPRRLIYKLWDERVPPAAVIEVTSHSTRRADLTTKRELYVRLGVHEYYLYDPYVEGMQYLAPPLQGFLLVEGELRPAQPDADGALLSDVLGLRLALLDGRLRLFDRATGAMLLDPVERLRAESDAVQAESTALRAAEARIAELEAELRRLRGESPS